MKAFDSGTLDRLQAGEVDYIDAATFIFDSGIANMWIGGKGSFAWTDDTIGTQTFYGGGSLLTLSVPGKSQANDSTEVTMTLSETYMVEGSDIPQNVWDNGVRASLDDEPWQGREVILSTFWRDENGVILMREQVERRILDSAIEQTDDTGRDTRVITLERPDIIQRDIEGKTDNAEFQGLIDPVDLGYEHAGTTVTQTINFGQIQDASTT